jgi:hypothetical protein
MARSTPIQLTFNGGEIAPAWAARADLARFGTSVAVMQNFVPMVQGPALRRSGFRYVNDVKASANATRLIPFIVSDIQGYVVEAGDLYFRFYKDEARLESPPGTPVEVVTTYLTADLFDLQFAQSADVLYIVHKDYPPRKLERLTSTSFQITTVDFFDGPYNAENTDPTVTMTPSATTGSITITASAATFEIGRDEGRWIRIRNDAAGVYGWGAAQIDTVSSTTVVTATVKRTLKGTTAKANWRLGAWYTGNYPRAVSFHGERLIFAADPDNPQTFYGSVAGDFESFVPTGNLDRKAAIFTASPADPGDTVTDSNAFTFALAANKVNVINWLTSLRTLIFGTMGGIWPAQASQELEAITPLNVTVQNSSTKGSSSIQPSTIEDSFLYISRTKRKAFLVAFRIESESYKPEDISLLASHLLLEGGGIVEMDYASEPNSTVWMVRSDGRLIGLTAELSQKVTGWHQHVPGGSFDGGDAVVESPAVIPATEGAVTTGAHDNNGHDQLWVVVKRTIDFVDSGITYDGAAATVITGLDHLEGETVDVLGDGSKQPSEVVASGQITIDVEASKVQVGLGYLSRLKTLPLNAPDPQGSSRGKQKRTDHVTLVFHRSLGGQISKDAEDATFEDLVLSTVGAPLGAMPELFSGDKSHALDCGWDRLADLEIRQADPYPTMLLAIVHNVDSSPRGTG